MVETARARRGRPDDHRSDDRLFDRELDHLPPEVRWREWMHRVEATIFAASEPVSRETLVRIVGKSCSIDLLIDDIRENRRGRPYDLVAVAGGWKHLTRQAYADAIRADVGASERTIDLTQSEVLTLMTIAYFEPITRAELSSFFGKEISRDLIGNLRGFGLIASGPRSPTPGAPTPMHDQSIPAGVRARHAARPAGLRGARGCRAAVEGQAAGRRHHAGVSGWRR